MNKYYNKLFDLVESRQLDLHDIKVLLDGQQDFIHDLQEVESASHMKGNIAQEIDDMNDIIFDLINKYMITIGKAIDKKYDLERK